MFDLILHHDRRDRRHLQNRLETGLDASHPPALLLLSDSSHIETLEVPAMHNEVKRIAFLSMLCGFALAACAVATTNKPQDAGGAGGETNASSSVTTGTTSSSSGQGEAGGEGGAGGAGGAGGQQPTHDETCGLATSAACTCFVEYGEPACTDPEIDDFFQQCKDGTPTGLQIQCFASHSDGQSVDCEAAKACF